MGQRPFGAIQADGLCRTRRWPARGVLLGLALLLWGCATPGELGPEHQPSGLATPLPGPDFAAYVEAGREHVWQGMARTDAPLAPEVIEARAPFELVPDARRCPHPREGLWPEGALLIHGLGGTPYEMRDLGRALAGACVLVRAILLPGHGTLPGDLLEIDHASWIEATRRGVLSFRGLAETVHLVGFSEGGALALHHALFDDMPEDLEPGGLVLIAPNLGARRFAVLLEPAQGLVGGDDPRRRWQTIQPAFDPVRYESLPRNAARQADALAAALRGRQGSLARPVFLVLSAEDAHADALVARRWFCRELIGPRRLIWYDRHARPVTDCRFVTVRGSGGDPVILDYAHRALPIAPDNPRYGKASEAFDCGHYYWDASSPNWLLCVDRIKTPENSEVRYGEVRRENLDGIILRRLTYNPDFEPLAGDMVAFLHEVRHLKNVPIPRLRPAR